MTARSTCKYCDKVIVKPDNLIVKPDNRGDNRGAWVLADGVRRHPGALDDAHCPDAPGRYHAFGSHPLPETIFDELRNMINEFGP